MEKENKNCTCVNDSKKTFRNDDELKKLTNRLNRIEGQIKGIRRMVENNEYCPNILIQSRAVIAAINAFNKELLSAHLKNCVVNDLKKGNMSTIDEVVDTFDRLMK